MGELGLETVDRRTDRVAVVIFHEREREELLAHINTHATSGS